MAYRSTASSPTFVTSNIESGNSYFFKNAQLFERLIKKCSAQIKRLCEGKSITEVKSYLAPSLGSKGISAKTNSKVSREEVVGEKKISYPTATELVSLSFLSKVEWSAHSCHPGKLFFLY